MKFGLMSYDYTTNIGNEVQSIAARRFLPKIDYYIEHEKLERFDEGSDVKMIMNAWYLDCDKAWPPSENIDPLLISMHFTTRTDARRDAVLTDESKEFFQKHGPVGCRDHHTVNFLNENGIDAFYTGCLTLTLDSGAKKIDSDEHEYIVLSVDNPNEILPFLKQKTDTEIYVIYQDLIPSFKKAYPKTMPKSIYTLSSFYNHEEKFFMAENLLRIYENAKCVITDRMHCALPSLALKTPVLMINNDVMRERFDGISELLHEATFEDYSKNYSKIFDINNPPENPKDYLKIRKDLIKRCEKFTGCVNDSCYTDISYKELLDKNSLILSRNAFETRKYIKDIVKNYRKDLFDLKNTKRKYDNQKEAVERLNKKVKDQQNAIDELNRKIADHEKTIKQMESSNSWKITKPIRKLKNRK
ncbi:polysaccharide pyruvyl transferase family protein [Methanobrevibacter sp.]|uniref:polysaccharide pyruvyl transferase family protein n=1 Tax=Methanobrevibacter sp. TaxID=66852 RepID=UPI0026DF27F8|nr:polysaccharide pyruvyl transferase family protein [Methanobrevibacter sp.]MDO5859639.1 polysaccharide pyruvyl transferase family protein [Methanobrevibacter sp.]